MNRAKVLWPLIHANKLLATMKYEVLIKDKIGNKLNRSMINIFLRNNNELEITQNNKEQILFFFVTNKYKRKH